MKGETFKEALRLPSSYRRVQGRLDGDRLGEEKGTERRRKEARDGERDRDSATT